MRGERHSGKKVTQSLARAVLPKGANDGELQMRGLRSGHDGRRGS